MSDLRLDPFERAARHPIVYDRPAVGFFAGALLGNGGLGAVVTTRPDAVVLHFGHNNVWDIRLAEDHKEKTGVFQDVFARIQQEFDSSDDSAWFREYCAALHSSYSKPYPRPFPCGSLLLGFDRRVVELLGHRLDIGTGTCDVRFLTESGIKTLQVFADMAADRVWLRVMDEGGAACALPFERVRLLPDPDTPAEIPPPAIPTDTPPDSLSFQQTLPFQEPHVYDPAVGHPKDRAFRLTVRLNDGLEATTRQDGMEETLARVLRPAPEFVACVQLEEGLASTLAAQRVNIPAPTGAAFEAAMGANRKEWEAYWRRSGVALADSFLERIWYWNLYFLNCAVKPGATCPGLFANWSYRKIGTAWHGDYHFNYNLQQPFWAAFSSNHVDKHLPYVDLVHFLLPHCRRWAQEYYGLRGAFFFHSAYPVEMTTNPYPLPHWGWEVCETPWAVQSLWWHYLYTMDIEFLRERAFPPIREAVRFLADYMRRPEAHGPSWGDDRYHIFPTVVPELYEITRGLEKNRDCLADLTLTKFVFRAYLQACAALGREETEAELMSEVRDILEHFPAYPTADSRRGRVFVSVPGEDPEIVYNVPVSTMTVFPGEDHGLHSPPEVYEIAANTYRNQKNEGGNELVFLNLQAARLGLLDLERFKRQILYCLLPNGTCADMVLQAQGRYSDHTPFEFMADMGVWFENFGLPVVVNECLLQSYDGVLRLFPNWPDEVDAAFTRLRAVGGFLVSASLEGGRVRWVEVHSEAGMPLRMIVPWQEGALCRRASGEVVTGEGTLTLETQRGETLRLMPR